VPDNLNNPILHEACEVLAQAHLTAEESLAYNKYLNDIRLYFKSTYNCSIKLI
jgi:hypothetical protein